MSKSWLPQLSVEPTRGAANIGRHRHGVGGEGGIIMATRTAEEELATLREDLAKLKADIGGLAKDLKDFGTAAAGAAGRAAREKGERLRGEIDETIEDLAERGEQTLRDARAKIEERPLAAVLIALLVGLVLGRLLDRR